MLKTSTRRITAIACGLVALAAIGPVTPAFAGTLAPQCIKARTLSNGDVRVENDCRRDKRIKVIMAWGPDLACYTIPAGGGVQWSDPMGRLDRVELC